MRVHDFIDPELGKAIPYGVYDVARNEGWAPYRVLRGGYFYYTAASLLPPYRSYSFPSYRYLLLAHRLSLRQDAVMTRCAAFFD